MPDPGYQANLPPERRPEPFRQPLAVGAEADVRQAEGLVPSLIPYRNPKALIAYYCGVFALIPCVGLLLGPAALVLGILGVRHANAKPQAKGMAHAIVGIVLGSLALLANLGALIYIVVLASSSRRGIFN